MYTVLDEVARLVGKPVGSIGAAYRRVRGMLDVASNEQVYVHGPHRNYRLEETIFWTVRTARIVKRRSSPVKYANPKKRKYIVFFTS